MVLADGVIYAVDAARFRLPKKLLTEARADEVIRTVVAAACPGKIVDGKVFGFNVADAIRIRNDDRGETAL